MQGLSTALVALAGVLAMMLAGHFSLSRGLPGRAWLEFEVEPQGPGAVIRQTAIFDPAGLSGLVYWYLLFPVHGPVFGGMLRGIAAHAALVAPRQKDTRSDATA